MTSPLRDPQQAVTSENSGRFVGVRATYDPVADALYLYLRPDKTEYARTCQINDWINADLAPDGSLIGFEIIGVSTLPQPGNAQDVP